MALLPIKMVLRWTINLKYIIAVSPSISSTCKPTNRLSIHGDSGLEFTKHARNRKNLA